jgi:hypothetical protein
MIVAQARFTEYVIWPIAVERDLCLRWLFAKAQSTQTNQAGGAFGARLLVILLANSFSAGGAMDISRRWSEA